MVERERKRKTGSILIAFCKKRKKVEMKNRVSLEGYGEILAGRIARPYEKGTPRAKQGDEYWFFIKHFASISREKASEREDGDREREKRRERKKERRKQTEREKEWKDGREKHLFSYLTVELKKTSGYFD